MAKKTDTATTTVEITEAQRNLVLTGLTNELLDSERYLRGSEVDDEPGPEDACCPAHLARYEHRKDMYRALKEKKKRIKATIALFEQAK